MTYLYYFYGFCLSALLYLLLIKIIPLPQIPPANDLLPYYHDYIFPQSHKLTAYFLAILTIIFGTPIIGYLIKKTFSRFSIVFSLLSNIITFSVFLFIIYQSLTTSVNISQFLALYNFLASPLFFLSLAVSFIILLYRYFSPHVPNLHQIVRRKTPERWLYSLSWKELLSGGGICIILLLIVLTLFDRTMSEKDIFVGRTFQYSHSVVFLDPIYDILKGKVLLVDTDAQYGLLINYLPALIFGITRLPVTFTNFFYLMIAYGVFYYFAIFIFLKKKLASGIWASLGIVALFAFHFYATADRYLRPMFFPIRYMLDIPFFLLLLTIGKKKLGHFILPLYLAFAILYNYETGIALTVSYLFYKTISNTSYAVILNEVKDLARQRVSKRFARFFGLRPQNDFSVRKSCSKLAKGLKTPLKILLSLLFLTSLYSLYAFFQTGQFPDWSRALFYLKLFGSGFIASDGPAVSFYLIPLVIYLVTIIRLIVSFRPSYIFDASLAVYGLSLFIYYIQRSYPANLSALSVPAVILGLGLFKELAHLVANSKDSLLKKTLFAPYIILGSLLIFSLIYYPFRLAANAKFPYWTGEKSQSAMLYDEIQRSSLVLDKYEKDAKTVTIISFFDTLHEIHTDKLNSLPYGSIQNIFTVLQEEKVLDSIQKSKPRYIYVNTEKYPEDRILPRVFEYLYQNYRVIDTVELLSVWEKNNR